MNNTLPPSRALFDVVRYVCRILALCLVGFGAATDLTADTPAPGPQIITSIRFYPRAGEFGWRMQGGRFEASNNNTTWTTLYSMVNVWPANNTWTSIPVSNATAWRYVRFVSNNASGYALNIAELEFYNGTDKLVGTGIGSPGSYQNDPSRTFDKALDGDLATFVDNSGGSWVGYDFGEGAGGTIPDAPTGLTAVPGDAQVVLSWTASDTATSYKIFRGTSPGGESVTPIASAVASTTYTDTAVTNGQTYYYQVAGVNASGTGAQSAEVSATPAATGVGPQVITSIRLYPRPGAWGWRMQGGRFEASNDNANWTVLKSMVNVWPADNTWSSYPVNNSTPWRYVRYVSNTEAGYALNLAELEFYNGATKLAGTGIGSPGSYQNDPTRTFDKALDGDITTFVDNSGGTWVGEDFGTGSGLPAAIADLNATPGAAKVTLAWTATGTASSYNIYRGTGPGAENGTPIATGVITGTYVDSSVVNETTYYYKVAGVNLAGAGPQSNEAAATPSASLAFPSAPSNLAAAGGDMQVSLTWTAADGATSYNVYRGTASGGEAATPVATGIAGTSFTDTGRLNYATYYYTVSGVNVNGTGAKSNEASAIPVPPDSAPVIVAQPVSRTTAAGATASFAVVVNAKPAPTYQWRKNGSAITGNSSALTATLALTSITNGDAASYDVVVTNGLGTVTSASATLTVGDSNTPATGRTGINVGWVNDYTGEVNFADAMQVSRQWENTTLDSHGWPQSDSSIYVWAGTSGTYNTSGTYALSFTGQADVTGATLTDKTYDVATNTTTAKIVMTNSDFLRLTFSNTKRLPDGPTNAGITNVKLMRPIEPGSSISYSPNTVFTTQSKAFYSKFSALRYMDWLVTNGNPSVNWSDRTLPDWATQFRWDGVIWSSRQMGASWEHAVRLANETNTDMWICIPVAASDDYITKLAQLIAYGSDGVNPYTSPQANPAWAPLNPGLKVYVEYSNELWNSAGPFPQFHTNRNAAVAEVAAGNSPLNFDGDANGDRLAARRSAKRTIEISNLFRGVFGDGAMMTRIRPVLESQQQYTGWWMLEQSHILQEYYNNPARVANPRPPSYYIYGGGGSAYYSPENGDPNLTIETIWTSNKFDRNVWAPICRNEVAYAKNLYGHRLAYEGGPGMDAGASNATKQAAWSHPLMTTNVIDHQLTWDESGSELLMFYVAIGDYQWGFARSVFDLNTPKLAAIDRLNASAPALGTAGALIPATIPASARLAPEANVGDTNNLSPTSGQTLWNTSWIGYLAHNTSAGAFAISLQAGSAVDGCQADIYVDGAFVGTVDIANTGSNPSGVQSSSVSTTNLMPGTHGILVKAKTGAFGFQAIVVETIPLSGVPGALTATPGDGQIVLSWDAATGAASYNIYRGTTPGSGSLLAAGVTATSYTDTQVVPGTTYYYSVAGVNPAGVGPVSNEAYTTSKLTAVVTLSKLEQRYDGSPRVVTATTSPQGLNVVITYDGSTTAPKYPGAYAVAATIDEPNYVGAAEDVLVVTTTLLVRHGPTLNGGVDGSMQLFSPESVTLNSSAWISRDLLVPGTPTVVLNSPQAYGGTIDATGIGTPSNYSVTLNKRVVLGHVVRRVDPVPLSSVSAPPLPAGTRSVSLNKANQGIGDPATLANLTLNSGAGMVGVPAGTYGTFVANKGTGFVLGVANAAEPVVYNLQTLTLNSGAQLSVIGPVILHLANGLTVSGAVGSTAHPEWLEVTIASGGLTLNTNSTFAGAIVAPNGTVSISGGATLTGAVVADRVTLNSNGLIEDSVVTAR